MLQMSSQNVDRSVVGYTELLKQLAQQPDYFLAALTQDGPCQDVSRKITTPPPEQYKTIEHYFKLGNQTIYINLTTIINGDKCSIDSSQNLGNSMAAGLLTRLLIHNTHRGDLPCREIYLVNMYIRPRAAYADTNQLLQDLLTKCNKKLSKVIIAWDLSASSALWDPSNLETVNRARTTKAKYYSTKVIRGNILERFIIKHNLKVLQPSPHLLLLDHTRVKATYVNRNQEKPIKAWIDVIIVGSKASRIWQSVDIRGGVADREHRIIAALCATNNLRHDSRLSNYRSVRYKPDRICKDDFIEPKLKVAKTRNNW